MSQIPATSGNAVLRAIGLTKRFGGLVAVNRVSLEVFPGEVVALAGDNGAGKSTLIKLISGVYRPDEGQIFLNGREITSCSPLEIRRLGIETIYQDLALCENLDAPSNIFLGREPLKSFLGLFKQVDYDYMASEAKRILQRLDIQIPDLRRPVREMSGGQRQAIAIARAVYWRAQVLIMDEPTAALGVPEQRKVHALIRALKAEGVPVVLISHNLQDLFAIADRVIVMRRGQKVADLPIMQVTEDHLVALMVGTV